MAKGSKKLSNVGDAYPIKIEDATGIRLFIGGTFTGLNCTFEGSLNSTDGTDGAWQTVQGVRSSDEKTTESVTGVVASALTYNYRFDVAGYTYFRTRVTAIASGNAVIAVERCNTAPSLVTISPRSSQTFPVSLGTNTPTLAAGTALAGDFGVQYRANATGAASIKHIISAATTNLTSVKASAGRLLGWKIGNTNAAWRYIKLHNIASAPTAGSGVVMTIGIPPGGSVQQTIEGGLAFSTGIGVSMVTGSADSDTVAVGAGDLICDLFYM